MSTLLKSNMKFDKKLIGLIGFLIIGIITVIVLFMLLVMPSFAPSKSSASNVSVYLTPSTGNISTTQDTNIDLYINTGGTAVTATSIFVKYDPSKVTMQIVQGEIPVAFVTQSAGSDTVEIQAGLAEKNAQGALTGNGYTGTGIIARLKVRAISDQASGSATISITDRSSLEIGGNVTSFTSQSIKSYVYNFGNSTSSATPIIVTLAPTQANITNFDDTYISININTVNQNVQGAKVYIKFDPNVLDAEALVGSIPDFGTSIFQSRIINNDTFEIQSGVSLTNQTGFNGTGTLARLKLRAKSTQKTNTNIAVLDNSVFGISSTNWIGISATSTKTYAFQVNQATIVSTSTATSSKSSANDTKVTTKSSVSSSISIINSKSSVQSAFSSISNTTTKTTWTSLGSNTTFMMSGTNSSALPSTGIIDEFGKGSWIIYLFVSLTLGVIVGLPMLTKVGSFERSIVKS